MSEANARLVGFLGVGPYTETNYVLNGTGEFRSRFCSVALARWHGPQEAVILCTPEANAQHGEELEAELKKVGVPKVRRITDFPANDPWKQFTALLDCFEGNKDGLNILLDITNSFRALPFFAAAALGFARSRSASALHGDGAAHLGRVSVHYGAFDRERPDPTQVWDLSAFVDLLDWTRAIDHLLATGRAEGVVARLEEESKGLSRKWVEDGKVGPPPRLAQATCAFAKFGNDLATLRTGGLLLGTGGKPGSAQNLVRTIAETKGELEQRVPPLGSVLDDLSRVASSLQADDLSSPEGRRSLLNLAKQYRRMGRFSEATATLREMDINRFATREQATPGHLAMKKSEARPGRFQAEQTWKGDFPEGKSPPIVELRNDVQHAGYNSQPLPADTIIQQIDTEIARQEKLLAGASEELP